MNQDNINNNGKTNKKKVSQEQMKQIMLYKYYVALNTKPVYYFHSPNTL